MRYKKIKETNKFEKGKLYVSGHLYSDRLSYNQTLLKYVGRDGAIEIFKYVRGSRNWYIDDDVIRIFPSSDLVFTEVEPKRRSWIKLVMIILVIVSAILMHTAVKNDNTGYGVLAFIIFVFAAMLVEYE